MKRATLADWALAVVVVFLWLVVLPFAARGAELQRVTYTDPTGRTWCAHVGYVDPHGVGGVAWAWVTIDADPRRVVHLPARELRAGCER